MPLYVQFIDPSNSLSDTRVAKLEKKSKADCPRGVESTRDEQQSRGGGCGCLFLRPVLTQQVGDGGVAARDERWSHGRG